MNQTRTVLGWLIMIFFAMLNELPREIIAEIPDLVDGVLLAAKDENIQMNAESRTWLTAIAGVATTPNELLRETGLNDWLEKELSESLRTVGNILNGKTEARNVWLNLRPLKQALNHPAMELYITQVLEKLPVCSSEQASTWERIIQDQSHYDSLPPCRPEASLNINATALIRSNFTRDIPDEINFFKNSHFPSHRINIAKTVMSFTYLLFLIPALFILFCALVAAGRKSHFFRWSGTVTMIGGGLALGLATLVKQIIPWSMHFSQGQYSSHWLHWNDVIGNHLEGVILIFTRHLVAPVIAVAGAVCVVGLLLFAFSFTFHSEPDVKVQSPQQPQAT
jgi:hypothetical protein